ncbi:coiled-coil domain-containing protein 191 isoform X2 [Trichomycterus rosablanca]|uniref:coiled-coil domain-containing protein 191 isoform X2 n=1 Tax=Trichomycterus rosablanca TaxID=2290929 RepID=UPI002F356C89
MAHTDYRSDLFQWRRFTQTAGTSSNRKVHLTDMDINSWMKRVEVASEYAVSEVFSVKKAQTGKPSRAVALQSVEQLQDHDDAYTEAQAILSDWMNQKMRLELEMDAEDEDLTGSNCLLTIPFKQPPDYKNFDDMYSKLAQEDDSLEVHNFLQDLMDTEVLDLQPDSNLKEGRDPSVTMEIRHKLVKERRMQRDAERERQRRVQEVQKKAQEEAQRVNREEQRRRKQEAGRQGELLQQEVIRLRKLMEEKRSVEQLARKMERERLVKRKTAENSVPTRPDTVTQRQLGHTQQEVETKLHIASLQCMQKHFSAWYSVVLEKRVCLGKAAALCDWRKQLRAWRAWRALVWARREEREAERTEEELRLDNKRCQVAEEGDRRRLLRRCLNDWRLWCLVEKERRELLNQQEETRQKMASLIDAAASGKLAGQDQAKAMLTARPESASQSENSTRVVSNMQVPVQRPTSAPAPVTLTDRKAAPPTQAWQVTRRHVAVCPSEAHEARPPSATEVHAGRFEHRHAAQQRTISEQRRLLKEQQDLILHLQEQQNIAQLRLQAERAEAAVMPRAQLRRPASQGDLRGGDNETRSKEASGEDSTDRPATREHVNHRAAPHPAIRAMEERARQREERRREVQEMKRKKEEEKLARMKADEEERRRQEEEEKRIEAEKRREERRLKKEKELEKQRRTEREQKRLKTAVEHHNRSLLLHRGMKPWKRLVENSRANAQKAVEHHSQVLQRRCLLLWLQAAEEAVAVKKARADQFYDRILLQRALHSWQRFKQLQSHLELQARRFYVARTQRKIFTALLDHTTHQRLVTWDKEQLASEHSARRGVRRCFGTWKRLPAAQREEREREVRREELRRRVAEILPDFRASPLDGIRSPTMNV